MKNKRDKRRKDEGGGVMLFRQICQGKSGHNAELDGLCCFDVEYRKHKKWMS